MGRRYLDVAGQTFGSLTALTHLGQGVWSWSCACGRADYQAKATDVMRPAARNRSCGCTRSASQSAGKTTHGRAYTVEYRAWKMMIARCTQPCVENYPNYGGRGIKVCEAWREDFMVFFRDMGPRPSPQHSVDRKNSDGNYEPDNCKWSTDGEQRRNKRTNVNLTFGGETKVLQDWAKITGLTRECIRTRLALGWPVERALTEPSHFVARVT